MLVILESGDWRKLSASARTEILNLVSGGAAVARAGASPARVAAKGPGRRRSGRPPALHVLDLELAQSLLESLNDRAQAVLRLAVRGAQPFDWARAASRHPEYHPDRFLAAVHRRLGTITKGRYRPLARLVVDGDKTLLEFAPATVTALQKALAKA